ncbi:MAG: tetratricopeptide repeat protein [Planctomycetes bacterium]|nr:tetratricopeptide repeat protein [Planctomycetota bacterium]
MDVHFNHFQQLGTGRLRKDVLDIAIVWVIALSFCIPVSSVSAVTESVTLSQKAAGVLRERLSVVSEELLKDFPDDIEVIKRSVEFYRHCQNPYRMMEVLEQGLRFNPGNYGLCVQMAKIAFNNGEYEKAVTYWGKALAIKPGAWQLHDNIAEAYISLGRYSEVVEKLEAKIKVSPRSARSYWLLGQGYMKVKKYEKAKECYDMVLEINPKYPQGHYWLGKTYMRLKQPAKAKEHMEIHRGHKNAMPSVRPDIIGENGSLQHHGIDVQLDLFSGVLARLCVRGSKLYRASGKQEEAQDLFAKTEKAFEQSLIVDPNQTNICREFSFLYISMDTKLDKAKELVEKAVALEESARNYFILSRAYYASSETAKALSAMEKAVEMDPNNISFRRVYERMKRKSTR